MTDTPGRESAAGSSGTTRRVSENSRGFGSRRDRKDERHLVSRSTHPVRHASHRRAHSIGRAVAVAVSAALGFTLVGAQTIATQFEGALHIRDNAPLVTDAPAAPADDFDAQPLNILLIGSDVRSGENAAIGGGDALGMRSDATVLVHMSGDRERIDVVSIPRDLQVTIPDCALFDGTTVPGREDSFNAAFSNGATQGDTAEAAACTINTVHHLTDIRIDHWAVLDFAGFTRMIDSLGGIPMCIPERVVSEKARLSLEAGPQMLDGAEALGWARLRTAEVGDVSGSDLQRINRQQELLLQTMKTAMAKNLFTEAGELTSFLRSGAESLTTDPVLGDLDFMLRLALSLRDLSTNDLNFTTVPWEYTDDRLDVLLTDDAPQMFDDLRHDRPLSVHAEDDATSEWGTDSDSSQPSPAAPVPDDDGRPDTIDDVLASCDV